MLIHLIGMPDPDSYSLITDWINDVFKSLKVDQMELFVMLCWNLWLARNDTVWRNHVITANTIALKTKIFLNEWKEITKENLSTNEGSSSQRARWSRPEVGWLKLNVDAAMDNQTRTMGFGWVLRNDVGTFIAAANVPWKGIYTPREAEAFALKEALSWLKSHGFERVQVKTDAMLVVQGLHSELKDSAFDLILHDVKDILGLFSQVNILFVKRSANRAAHMLTRDAVSRPGRSEWWSTPLLFFVMFLMMI